MLLHIEAEPHAALHTRLRLPESAYRHLVTPYGHCHVFGLPGEQAALLFEHFPLDLQPNDGQFPAPGPIARKYNNARIYAHSALAAAACRSALAELLDEAPGDPAQHRITLTNTYLPSTALHQAAASTGLTVEVHPQAAQPDMAELILHGTCPLQDILHLALSLAALSDPEAIHWLNFPDYQQLRADAATWLGDAAESYDQELQRRATRHYNPAYKLLVDDGDAQLVQDDHRAQIHAEAEATGLRAAIAAEVLHAADGHTHIALLDASSLSPALPLLSVPWLQHLAIFQPAVHILQHMAAQFNQSGLSPAQAAALRLSPQAAWIQDTALRGYGLMAWLDALDGLQPDLLSSGLHNLLQFARPEVLLLTGHGPAFWQRPGLPLHRHPALDLPALEALALRLRSQYPAYSCAVEALPGLTPAVHAHLIRLTRLPQP